MVLQQNIRIDLAVEADIPAMSALLGTLFTQEADFTPDPRAQARGLRLILDNPDAGLLLVARRGEDVVAMATILFTISTAQGSRVALLDDLVVRADQRGHGVGRRLLDAVISQARAKGCSRLTLLTDGANMAAQHLYRSAGFTASAMMPFRLYLD